MVLDTVARRLSNTVRGTDLVARLGGDEFVLATPPPDARGCANRILAAIAAPVLLADGTEVHVGVSVGIALPPPASAPGPVPGPGPGPGPTMTAIKLLELADGSMYRAKRSGKHCYAEAVITTETAAPSTALR